METPRPVRVRYSRRAEQDLARILDYIDQRSPSGARNVKIAIRTTVALIGQYPDVGRPAHQDTRVLPVGRFPYLVYWTQREAEVLIIHIRHAARTRPLALDHF